ncbi:DinB family protein [Aquimarina sp. MMG016]|uniref:DinB family protein n=1 Tax=Aquimarina sp. MMG016 TaxID=2822690 RepID=UPI001B39D064|nr:DinB family protein [Aquimarina sp. MMG016]MBQ4819514.1 DinB family protein [Aquimarina sp. MMG016]
MKFNLNKSIEILQRTPNVLITMLQNMDKEWVFNNEGEKTWSVYDIIGHFIHGEKTDWIPRMEIILSDNPDKTFIPFDRFAQFENSKGKTLKQLLDEFQKLRKSNIEKLISTNLTDEDLQKTGIHPDFGSVTLSQLLATWVVHDLNHIAQISRVIAKQYTTEVGPWSTYLRILKP